MDISSTWQAHFDITTANDERCTDSIHQNSRTLRRLATDHNALHQSELPPNYLFPADTSTDDLTQLDILLAGPTCTPFASGVWKLHLSIPPTYPQQPPTAHFRTPIFHPNVDPLTGGVCVETLKRDWLSSVTLRDVLVTISCLLIQPNPDSALNAEAGALIRENYDNFARRAELMTSIHAVVPRSLVAAVKEAQNRGQDPPDVDEGAALDPVAEAPVRRRRTLAQARESARRAKSETTPTCLPGRRRQHIAQNHQTAVQTIATEMSAPTRKEQHPSVLVEIQENHDDESDDGDEQENDATKSPPKIGTPTPAMTPRRSGGVAVPLAELIMEPEEQYLSEDMELEYPPSPSKSLSRSPWKRQQAHSVDARHTSDVAESSRNAMRKTRNVTSPTPSDKSLAEDQALMDVTFENPPSPPKWGRGLFQTPAKRPPKGLFGDLQTVAPDKQHVRGISKTKSPSAKRQSPQLQKRKALDAKLWMLCGSDIRRWNQGDFDGEPFKRTAGRW